MANIPIDVESLSPQKSKIKILFEKCIPKIWEIFVILFLIVLIILSAYIRKFAEKGFIESDKTFCNGTKEDNYNLQELCPVGFYIGIYYISINIATIPAIILIIKLSNATTCANVNKNKTNNKTNANDTNDILLLLFTKLITLFTKIMLNIIIIAINFPLITMLIEFLYSTRDTLVWNIIITTEVCLVGFLVVILYTSTIVISIDVFQYWE